MKCDKADQAVEDKDCFISLQGKDEIVQDRTEDKPRLASDWVGRSKTGPEGDKK